MPVHHHGDPAEGGLGLFGGNEPVKKTRLQRAEDARIKTAVLRKYKLGQRLADPRTGAIAVVDASAPRGLRPVFKAVNAHNHLGGFTLGKDDLSKARQVETYDGPEYGKLAGSEDEIAKRRRNRPSNPNSRL